ncbi:hypothetical protein COU54_04225 [Candidatus Pacearchaeota archaeon CG10_big_fil_rev_8_21_14_0_10_31_24]|nr:MAG: hypothetical protein COU54_04225 [Candidatus Pacearchaeota archaeon CG10_big_fil_rev_8_21_14_0_10_31_24]
MCLSNKAYLKLSGTVFLIVSLFHLSRVLMNLPLTWGSYSISIWFSVVVVIILGYLSYSAFKLVNSKDKKK